MENCLVTKLKGIVDNPNLPVYGMAVAYIDTTGASDNRPVGYRGDIRGLKIIEGGTFVDGTTEVTVNTNPYVAPNKVLKVLYPKYKCFILPSLLIVEGSTDSMCAYDFDDLKYCEVRDAPNITGLRLAATPGGIAPRGNIGNFLTCVDKTNLQSISLQYLTENADITFNIEDLIGCPLASIGINKQNGVSGNINNLTISSSAIKVEIQYCINVTGDRETAFRNYVQSNPTAFKNRTDFLTFAVFGSSITYVATNVNIRYQFTGTNIVDILKNADQTKLGEYNIDTDTYTWL